MVKHNPKPDVFISHSSVDTWVAKQIASHVRRCGATTFLDAADIHHGDDFDDKIRNAAKACREIVVLLTPWFKDRPYIWIEMGIFFGDQKRIVGILHGLTAKDLSTDERIPSFLKKLDLVSLNDIDSYFSQLKARVKDWRRSDG